MKNAHIFERETFDFVKIQDEAKKDLNGLITSCEEFYHNQIKSIADDIAHNSEIKIVLMAGPSSSGKTTSSNLIREYLANYGFESIVVSMDDFFLNRDKTPRLPDGSFDFENYTAVDLESLNQFDDDLFVKGEAKMPIFNFKTGYREEKMVDIKLNPNTIVIIEGIHALNPAVFKAHLENMYKIYICLNTNFDNGEYGIIPAQKIRLMRRLIRDYRTRGMSIGATLNTWHNVLEGEDKYIKPYKNTADFLLNSTHGYEPMMYCKYLKPLLEKEHDHELAKVLLKYLNNIEPLDKKYLPEDSLLHEFLG